VLPGFGVAGILGIALILAGLFGILITNAPDELPWPDTTADWEMLSSGVLSLALGFGGFLLLAWILSRYLPKLGFMSGLILVPVTAGRRAGSQVSMTAPPESVGRGVQVGDVGATLTRLRPAGKARFGDAVVDVVATGEFVDKGAAVEIMAINGSRVVVRKVKKGSEA
jgi:membrane-bound serine protease (ClpP class)